MSCGFLVVSRFRQPKTAGPDVVEFLPRIFIWEDECVVRVDGEIEPRNQTGELLRCNQTLIDKLPVQAAIEVGRQNECIFRDIAVVEIECKRCLVLLDWASDIAVPKQV